MKRIGNLTLRKFLVIGITFFSFHGFSQEICNNAIDDDGDGLIDLNDDECNCEGFGVTLESLIPNPSFEERTCCPSGYSQLHCADDWIQASEATTDYLNACDFDAGYGSVEWPLPGGGEGFVGFHANGTAYMEYVGTMLTEPMLAGTEYTLNLHLAWGLGLDELELCLFATPSGDDDLPWGDYNCPIGEGDWELLTSLDVELTTDGAWHEVTLTFVPPVDMDAIAIGGPCDDPPSSRYYYADELILLNSESYPDVTKTGSWCDGDLNLEVELDTTGGEWQWYMDGVALLGETDATVNVMAYGFGDYSAVYFLEDNCIRKDRTIAESGSVSVGFDYASICLGNDMNFDNTSVAEDGVFPDWYWDFGDGSTSNEESPTHVYSESGTYTVELIAVNDLGCEFSIEHDVVVYPVPNANIEFIVNGVSSEDGATGGCYFSEVQFNDLSTIEVGGEIVDWDWDFGDGSGSEEENPTHTYDAPGTYEVTLTVTSDNDCEATHSLDIIMREASIDDLDCYVHVGENNQINLDLYPNPVTDFLTISAELKLTTVVIFDLTGKVIYEFNEINSNSMTANFDQFSAGLYLVQVITEFETKTLKVEKI